MGKVLWIVERDCICACEVVFFCLCEEPVALGAVGEIEVGDERLEFGEAGAGDGCGWFLIEVCFNVSGCGGGVGDSFVA